MSRGRLTGVSGGGHTATYALDGDGDRVSQTVDSVTTAFDLDLRGMPTVLVAGGDAYLPGMPSLGSSDGTDWTGALTDAQGSVLRHIDDTGWMTALTRYDPYGGARPSTTLPEGIGFTGEWADATGLVNLRARAYDPSLGAFLSRDSFPGIATMPLTGNRHAYASGNPLRFTDPSGRFISVGQDFLSFAWLSQDPVQLIVRTIEDGPGIGGMVEGGLDAAGFIPGIGDAIDLGRAAFDFARYLATGDQDALVQAAIGAVAAIPIIGSLGKEGARHADEVLDVAGMGARRGDDVLDGAALGAGRGGSRLDTGGSLVGRACSFDGATGVLMADGSTKPISRVEVGDRVVAVDPGTGERTIETVTAVWAHEDELVVLRVEGGSIVTTEDHPYWDTTDGRWEEAQLLERGDLLRAADGTPVRVLGLVCGSARDGLAWNLTVSGPHTYHVLAGDAAVLVHNCAARIGAHIAPRLKGRGWTTTRIDEAMTNPARVVEWRDTRHFRGGRMDDPATAYYHQGGGYVVVNNRTKDVVQVSNLNDLTWVAPWD